MQNYDVSMRGSLSLLNKIMYHIQDHNLTYDEANKCLFVRQFCNPNLQEFKVGTRLIKRGTNAPIEHFKYNSGQVKFICIEEPTGDHVQQRISAENLRRDTVKRVRFCLKKDQNCFVLHYVLDAEGKKPLAARVTLGKFRKNG